ncbi:MAG: ImmA/IrrE family metallo-endopeptidase [Actinomycetota bacterium]|nr:ImmA/IrrE family metallo-endopeptidase [Actinomycetota bacterium]
MALKTDIYYKGLAEETLKRAGIIEPPVPVTAVADYYGLPVRDVDMPGFFHAATINEDGLPVVLLNVRRDESTRYKALAHLIGHLLIVLDDSGASYPRDNLDHRAADVIAEELLMPSFMVREQAAKWFNDYRYLARLFGVTEQEMMRKMLDLGIIKQRGVLWDY